jgi:hypothetical protein
MRPKLRLGLVNLALVSLYFVPVWGNDALRALTSPYNGFEDRAHAAVAVSFRDVFDLGLTGLLRTSSMLAGIKMVVAAGFVAYLIEFARALATRQEPNRETVDALLLAAVAAITVWMLSAVMLGDVEVVRLQATQFLLLVGAAGVIMIERQIERPAEIRSTHGATDPKIDQAPVRSPAMALAPAAPACAPRPPRSDLPAGRPA